MYSVLAIPMAGLVFLTGSLGLTAGFFPSTPDVSVADGPAWAAPETAAIHPGIQTFTDGAQCTANFVFYDATDLYIGQAAHCAGTGSSTETDGCSAGTLPVGTHVGLGTGHDGVVAYSSWATMQALGEKDADTCAYNDLTLVRIDPADAASVSPQVPFFGGPTGLAPSSGLASGDEVYSFGNSGLRLGVEPVLSWKHGVVLSSDAWTTNVYTATPGIPGDSGSGFLTADGQAFGVLSTVELLPLAGSNNAGSLASEVAYMQAHGGPQVTLGTPPTPTHPLNPPNALKPIQSFSIFQWVASPFLASPFPILPRRPRGQPTAMGDPRQRGQQHGERDLGGQHARLPRPHESERHQQLQNGQRGQDCRQVPGAAPSPLRHRARPHSSQGKTGALGAAALGLGRHHLGVGQFAPPAVGVDGQRRPRQREGHGDRRHPHRPVLAHREQQDVDQRPHRRHRRQQRRRPPQRHPCRP
jgi:hypothetical protein